MATLFNGPAASKVVVAMLRKAIAPHLPPLQLAWDQVEPLVVAATAGGVGGMLERARALLRQAGGGDAAAAAESLMLELAGEAADELQASAVRLLVAMLAKAIAPKLGLQVQEVLPALEEIDTVPELQEALRNVAVFLNASWQFLSA